MTIRVEKGQASVPMWAAITIIVSLLIAMGGVYYGWANKLAQSDLVDVRANIRSLENNLSASNNIDVAQTSAIVDIKTEVTDRLARIETTLAEIKQRVR